jgi:hypothetical protein
MALRGVSLARPGSLALVRRRGCTRSDGPAIPEQLIEDARRTLTLNLSTLIINAHSTNMCTGTDR